MNIEIHLRVAGILQLVTAALHILLPRALQWRTELGRLSLVNRQIFLVHTFFIVLILALFGSLSLLAADALTARSPLGMFVSLGLSIFWFTRLLVQFLVYDPQLWRGDKQRTIVHVVFSMVWFYLVAVYVAVLMRQVA